MAERGVGGELAVVDLVRGRVPRRTGRDSGAVGLGAIDGAFALRSVDLTVDGLDDVVGVQVDDGTMAVRSVASGVPDQQVPDATPVDPDQPEGGDAARAPAAARTAVVMMTAEKALRFGTNIAPKTASNLLSQLKFLGATRMRTFAWWGQIDRLAQSDEDGLVLDSSDEENPATRLKKSTDYT